MRLLWTLGFLQWWSWRLDSYWTDFQADSSICMFACCRVLKHNFWWWGSFCHTRLFHIQNTEELVVISINIIINDEWATLNTRNYSLAITWKELELMKPSVLRIIFDSCNELWSVLNRNYRRADKYFMSHKGKKKIFLFQKKYNSFCYYCI